MPRGRRARFSELSRMKDVLDATNTTSDEIVAFTTELESPKASFHA